MVSVPDMNGSESFVDGLFHYEAAWGEVGSTYEVTFTVTDCAGGSADTLVTIEITDVNQQPMLVDCPEDDSIDEAETYTFDFDANDPDGDDLTFSMTCEAVVKSGCDDASIDPVTGVFTFEPDYVSNGTYNFVVMVHDNGDPVMGDTCEFTIEVIDVNACPVWVQQLADTLYIKEGVTFTDTLEAYDADGDYLAWLINAITPTSSTIQPIDDHTAKFTWTPDYEAQGEYLMRFICTDGTCAILSHETLFYVEDTPLLPPTFTAELASQTIIATAGEIDFTYVADDANIEDELTFVLVEGPTGAVFTDNGDWTATLEWTPTPDDAGVHTVTVSVSDGVHDPVETTATITVYRYGDTSLNSTVSALDASLVLQHAAGTSTLTGYPLTLADVSGNSTVSAYDASLILQFSVGLISSFPIESKLAKPVIASGEVNWESPSAVENTNLMKLPIKLQDARNVYSVTFTANIDESVVEIAEISALLPESWQMLDQIVDGKLTIVFAGTEPLQSGEIGAITFKMLSKDAETVFSGEAAINENKTQSLTSLEIRQIPTEFALNQNYPNPFNPTTSIRYQLPKEAHVTISIYNILGNKVRTLVDNQAKPAGYYLVQWDGLNDAGNQLPSGTYLYHINAGSFNATKKMLLMK
jgi:hypothetical protein